MIAIFRHHQEMAMNYYTVILLRTHSLGEADDDSINYRYVAELVSNDWGFWYTVRTNLMKLRDYHLKDFKECGSLTDEDAVDVDGKINSMLEAIEKEPKTLSWKIRAAIGPAKKWYTDVEGVVR